MAKVRKPKNSPFYASYARWKNKPKKYKRKTHFKGFAIKPVDSPFHCCRNTWTNADMHTPLGNPTNHTSEWLMDVMQDSSLRDNLFTALEMFCDIYEFKPAYMFDLLALAEEGDLEAYRKIIIYAETVNIYFEDTDYVDFVYMEQRRMRKCLSVHDLRPHAIKPMRGIYLRQYNLKAKTNFRAPVTCGYKFREFRMLRRLLKQIKHEHIKQIKHEHMKQMNK